MELSAFFGKEKQVSFKNKIRLIAYSLFPNYCHLKVQTL